MNNIENTDVKIAVTWELQQNTYKILPEYTAKELKNRILFLLDSEVIEEHYVVLHLKDSRAIFLADNQTVKDFLPQIQYISIESKRIHPGNILIKHWTKLSDDHVTNAATPENSQNLIVIVDIENIPLAKDVSLKDYIKKFEKVFGKVSKFNIVYSKTNENPKLKELPSKNFPNVILTPVSISLKDIKDQTSSRNLADKEIKRLIRSYSGLYKKKWQLVLVTGDKDFLIDLFYLTKVEGITTFLIHKDTSGELFQSFSTYSCFVDEIWKVPVSDDGSTDTKMPLMSDKNNSDMLSVQQNFIEEIVKPKRIKVSSRNLLYEFHIYPFDTKDNFLRQISFLMISYNPKNIEFIPDEIENESFYNNVVEGRIYPYCCRQMVWQWNLMSYGSVLQNVEFEGTITILMDLDTCPIPPNKDINELLKKLIDSYYSSSLITIIQLFYSQSENIPAPSNWGEIGHLGKSSPEEEIKHLKEQELTYTNIIISGNSHISNENEAVIVKLSNHPDQIEIIDSYKNLIQATPDKPNMDGVAKLKIDLCDSYILVENETDDYVKRIKTNDIVDLGLNLKAAGETRLNDEEDIALDLKNVCNEPKINTAQQKSDITKIIKNLNQRGFFTKKKGKKKLSLLCWSQDPFNLQSIKDIFNGRFMNVEVQSEFYTEPELGKVMRNDMDLHRQKKKSMADNQNTDH